MSDRGLCRRRGGLMVWFLGLVLVSGGVAAVEVGEPAPLPGIVTVDGAEVDLAAVNGERPLYLFFWGVDNMASFQDVGAVRDLHARFGDRLAVYAVNAGPPDSPADVMAFRRRFGLSYPMVFDGDQSISEAYGVAIVPVHILVGRDGRVAYRHTRPPRPEEVAAWLDGAE